LLAVLVLAVAVAGFQLMHHDQARQPAASQTSQTSPPPVKAAAVAAPVAKPADECAGNGSAKLILVDISQRHLWACDGAKTAYDSPVITGMSAYASTVTPTGTYHVHGKQTNLTLTGSDITGSWSDPVRYWMPFLNNKYGTYGFHDATWRSPGSFGKVSPDSSKASHGCVELPLSAAAWLYQWTPVGTPVTIKN
jgi:lipoprotein-anchoring transpeptidase ErfK/SrfK